MFQFTELNLETVLCSVFEERIAKMKTLVGILHTAGKIFASIILLYNDVPIEVASTIQLGNEEKNSSLKFTK